jgi:hypothetical protein
LAAAIEHKNGAKGQDERSGKQQKASLQTFLPIHVGPSFVQHVPQDGTRDNCQEARDERSKAYQARSVGGSSYFQGQLALPPDMSKKMAHWRTSRAGGKINLVTACYSQQTEGLLEAGIILPLVRDFNAKRRASFGETPCGVLLRSRS